MRKRDCVWASFEAVLRHSVRLPPAGGKSYKPILQRASDEMEANDFHLKSDVIN
jgi:hypothetical protein